LEADGWTFAVFSLYGGQEKLITLKEIGITWEMADLRKFHRSRSV
jgi:hypothetical protein